jgi:type III restriction enzyme
MVSVSGPSNFRFDGSQEFQLRAIESVVGLFSGQPTDSQNLITSITGTISDSEDKALLEFARVFEVGAVGNNLVVDREIVLANLQEVQDANGLEVASQLVGNSLEFDIEMETGTGKTYVYLRTIFELAKNYNFTKFVILVPSVAIREGVATSIRLMKEHFKSLYPLAPFDWQIYSGKNAEEVQGFATSTSIQILIMTIDSIRGDSNNRVIHQYRDKLNGLRPLDYLMATRPIVIMDEPQNMESLLSQTSIGELNPAFTLRYSATHKITRNLVYRLDPVDAHELGLVKQIVVSDVRQQGADAAPYINLISVKRDPTWSAGLELSGRDASGNLVRKVVNVRQNQELSDARLTGNPAYEGIWVSEMNIGSSSEPAFIELNLHGVLSEGESIGGANTAIFREMIRETIREHLRKEQQLRAKGIKVLSLFFVDKVASYLGDSVTNQDANGDFAKWFDELFLEETAKNSKWGELFTVHPSQMRKAYFSQLKRGKATVAQDTSGSTKADDDAYELIMKDKQRLLDQNEPVRFIFSHSALREGWDNPNVFQICTLREMGAEVERRQTIGRGLRLPVMQTEQGYERVTDRGIASLTVIANESYQAFAKSLQNEYKANGIQIGKVRVNEFAKIPMLSDDGIYTETNLGFAKSQIIFDHLTSNGFLADGQVTSKFIPNSIDFSLALPGELDRYETHVVELMANATLEKFVKPKSKRLNRVLNKAIYLTPEFEAFWESISRRSTYRVSINRENLIDSIARSLQAAPQIPPLRVEVTKADIKVVRGGAKSEELSSRSAVLQGSYELPDIVSELQNATSLTRWSIVDILVRSERLAEFIGNPNDFISMAKRAIQSELAKLVVGGIQYERIAGSLYELRELQKDGEEEKDRFLDQMYKVKNLGKSDFDYVVFDSEVERQFAEKLDSREDVKFFMKLPAKFKIPTPVGDYNPDWAIIKQVGGQDRLYMIRETKSTLDELKLRPAEAAKIASARQHFRAIGIDNYEVSAPEAWNL